jgi:hypothetical protein
MKLWIPLYLMIWMVFVEFLLVMTPALNMGLLDLHVFLGIFIIGLAFYNFNRLRLTSVPGRVKRIARATCGITVATGILGVLLYSNIGTDATLFFGVTVWGVIFFLHEVAAFAIITQAAAVAIAYDMWEDKEFEKESAPRKVPASPRG